mmetsp:Transcript_8868/g.12629  ORF Transcript_8868/g.12629 Transcript_8868/m.12629 type:complete len:312 (+) Transcript_8868:35-970(+)
MQRHNEARLRFAICCTIPLCAMVTFALILLIVYVEMNRAVSISRVNVCPPGSENKIPKILHQTWKDENIPEKWKQSSQSCINLNPDYERRFWTDDDIEEFIRTEYPWFMPTYISYPYPIQRIDAARLLILYHYGGVYTDLDIECREEYPFDSLLENLSCHNLAFLETTPCGVTNMVIFSTPKHHFLKKCIDALPGRENMWGTHHTKVMLTAGPTFISHMMRHYPEMSDIFVFSLKERHAMFNDFLGKSWHTNDTKVLKVMDQHLWTTVGLIFILVLMVLYSTYKLCLKTSGHSIQGYVTIVQLKHNNRKVV